MRTFQKEISKFEANMNFNSETSSKLNFPLNFLNSVAQVNAI